jgi:hypothetical protein
MAAADSSNRLQNNFYNDGVKFHDVSCHHIKPTICEA